MNKILSIPVQNLTKKQILEKITLFIVKPSGFFHVVSLNPENLVIAQSNKEFKNILSQSDIKLTDGIGIELAARYLGISTSKRFSGVDLMDLLLKTYNIDRLRVLFIGGKGNLAETVADCYNKINAQLNCIGIEGISDIFRPTKAEEELIFSIVADHKPQIVFAAFGSPQQELWFYRQKEQFKGIICMGVGGAFDFVAGTLPRAPGLLRLAGLEWLFRLIMQPWRIKRQLRLVEFVYLVLKQKLSQS